MFVQIIQSVIWVQTLIWPISIDNSGETAKVESVLQLYQRLKMADCAPWVSP